MPRLGYYGIFNQKAQLTHEGVPLPRLLFVLCIRGGHLGVPISPTKAGTARSNKVGLTSGLLHYPLRQLTVLHVQIP